jgi:hypothetical protein
MGQDMKTVIRTPLFLSLLLVMVQSAFAGMVGIITDIRPESRIIQIDKKNYSLAKDLRIEHEGRGSRTIELNRQKIGQGIYFELDGNVIRTIRLLDKPVLN